MSRRILWVVILLSILAFAGFIVTEYSLRQTPEIDRLNKLLCVPGEKILIEGSGFGSSQGNSTLYFGKREIKSSHIELWEERNIRFRVPSFEGSTLVSVKTGGGKSRGVLIYHRDQFPQLQSGSFLPGLPYIEYVDPSSGASGTLISLKGYHFGINRGESTIWVNKTRDNQLSYFDIPRPEDFFEADEEDYLLWENDQVRFYLPDHVQSGYIYLKTLKGFSNPVYFDVEDSAGTWNSRTSRGILIEQKIRIDRVGALGDNGIYLWIPRPKNDGNQRGVQLIESSHETYLQKENIDLVRLENLKSGEEVVIQRKLLLVIDQRRAEIEPEKIPYRYNTQRELYRKNTREEEDFPLSDPTLRSIAVSVVKGVSNPYNRARKCYDYIKEKMDPLENITGQDPLTALREEKGGSEAYADNLVTQLRILGIPARKISGLLLMEDRRTAHFWVEVYFERFGWFSMDPFLADLSTENGNEGGDDFYWGGEGADRIAFSRGNIHVLSLDDLSVIQSPLSVYSDQNIYEEKWGNLASYRSEWMIPEVIDSF